MSRIGKKPIILPQNVSALLDGNSLTVSGKYGSLHKALPKSIFISITNNSICLVPNSWNRISKKMLGLTRTLVQNMVLGVSQQFTKSLYAEGIGYKFILTDRYLHIYAGFVHPVEMFMPLDLNVKLLSPTKITIQGIDKEQVGLLASRIKLIKPPEPYKGKGIFYDGEIIQRKIGKKTK